MMKTCNSCQRHRICRIKEDFPFGKIIDLLQQVWKEDIEQTSVDIDADYASVIAPVVSAFLASLCRFYEEVIDK